jgi:transposase
MIHCQAWKENPMPRAVDITRKDYNSRDLRKYAGKARTAEASRRMLAIANVLDGMSRVLSAKLAGLDRQSLRDWVHRYNAEGPEGLYDRKAPGARAKLDEKQRQRIKEIVLKGPDAAKDGLVRWRCCDIKDVIWREYGVSYHEDHIGRLLDTLGLSYITGRPRHPKGDLQKQEEFKKTSGRSSRKLSPNTPKARPSKSGSRTRQGSGKKAG